MLQTLTDNSNNNNNLSKSDNNILDKTWLRFCHKKGW